MPAPELDGSARIALLCPGGPVVDATSAALTLFGAKDLGELESRMLLGGGPSARRLRHMAATLPAGEATRLERLRFFSRRRPMNLNFRCARIATPEGALILVLSADAAEQESVPPARSAPSGTAETSPKARFLWTLDAEGRFGDPHPILAATVGANAPRHGESFDAWSRRIGVERGDELARVLGERATFSDMIVDVPVEGTDRQMSIALSAAPAFDRNREFAGYRGFGAIGDAIEATIQPPRAESPLRTEPNIPAPDRGAETADDLSTTKAGGDAGRQDEPGAEFGQPRSRGGTNFDRRRNGGSDPVRGPAG